MQHICLLQTHGPLLLYIWLSLLSCYFALIFAEALALEALKKKKAKEKGASGASSKVPSGASTRRSTATGTGDGGDDTTEGEYTDGTDGEEQVEELQQGIEDIGIGTAVESNEIEITPEEIAAVIKSGPEAELRYDTPKTPLFIAVIGNKYETVKTLIHEQPIYVRIEFVNQYDDNGNSPIFYALQPEYQDILLLLLDYGVDPCFTNNRKTTPLHLGCALNVKKSIKILIDYGADVQMENWEYQQPHQMVKEADKVSAMQAYLNSTYEAHKEAIKEKKKHAVNRYQRSYVRSIFDIADPSKILKTLSHPVFAHNCLADCCCLFTNHSCSFALFTHTVFMII